MIKALTVYYTVWLILMEYYSILKRKEKEYASQKKKKRNIDNIIIFKIIFKILEWVWRLWTEHHLFLH